MVGTGTHNLWFTCCNMWAIAIAWHTHEHTCTTVAAAQVARRKPPPRRAATSVQLQARSPKAAPEAFAVPRHVFNGCALVAAPLSRAGSLPCPGPMRVRNGRFGAAAAVKLVQVGATAVAGPAPPCRLKSVGSLKACPSLPLARPASACPSPRGGRLQTAASLHTLRSCTTSSSSQAASLHSPPSPDSQLPSACLSPCGGADLEAGAALPSPVRAPSAGHASPRARALQLAVNVPFQARCAPIRPPSACPSPTCLSPPAYARPGGCCSPQRSRTGQGRPPDACELCNRR